MYPQRWNAKQICSGRGPEILLLLTLRIKNALDYAIFGRNFFGKFWKGA